MLVSLHGVHAVVLKRVSFDLVQQTDATSFLRAHVNEHATSFAVDLLQGSAELRAAVAASRAESVARDAFRVHAHERRKPRFAEISFDQGHVLDAVDRAFKTDDLELAGVFGWQL